MQLPLDSLRSIDLPNDYIDFFFFVEKVYPEQGSSITDLKRSKKELIFRVPYILVRMINFNFKGFDYTKIPKNTQCSKYSGFSEIFWLKKGRSKSQASFSFLKSRAHIVLNLFLFLGQILASYSLKYSSKFM